jgi:penicillin-binding protein 2
MDTDSPRLRLGILAVVVLSLFGALFSRLWYLQVMVSDQYQVQAAANRVRTVAEEAPRGRILDVKGRVLVDNRISRVVTITRKDYDALSTADQDDLLKRIAVQLTTSGTPTKVAALEVKLQDPQYNGLQPIPIAIDVPADLLQYFAERSDEYPSVNVERRSVREYPYGALAAHIVGYVGRASDDELKAKQGGVIATRTIDKPYQPESEIGKTGVERSYEDYLRGTPGIRTIEVDAKNRPVRVTGEQPPLQGDDVQLTIDIDAQLAAEEALAQQLAALQGKRQKDGTATKAPAGSVVAMDPNNGNVIAMASYPTYNPAEFVNGISQDRFDELTKGGDASNPLINRAIQGQYAPGSTFKLITATAALERGMITANTSYPDNGSYTIIGCKAGGKGCETRHNSGGTVNGTIALPTAITVSSDVYFYWLGDRFFHDSAQYGATGIQDTARAYGLGSMTGIPLLGEGKGLVLDAELAKKRHEENPEAFPEGGWFSGSNVNLAIGQAEVLVTPLQLTNAYATLANRGTVYQPQVVARVLKSKGDPNDPNAVVATVQPSVTGHVDLPANIYDPLVAGFRGVIDNPKGTAHAPFAGFDTAAFPLAGKTGTAQVNGKADTSLFVSFGPVGAPGYVVAAVLEESGFGADAAAPVVRHVWEQLTGQVPTAVNPQQTGIFG